MQPIYHKTDKPQLRTRPLGDPSTYRRLACLTLVLTTALCTFILTLQTHTGLNAVPDSSSPDVSELGPDVVEVPGSPHHHPPPMWGQMEDTMFEQHELAGVPVLLMLYTDDLEVVVRSLESILTTISGSQMYLVVSVSDPSTALLRLLRRYPITLHVARQSSDGLVVGFLGAPGRDMCVMDSISPFVTFLHTDVDVIEVTNEEISLEEMEQDTRGVPFQDNPYNPMYRRAALTNSLKESTECQEAKGLKEALRKVVETFPAAEYVILMQTGYTLSPDILSYYKQLIPVAREDRSLYCISALHPLSPSVSAKYPSKVYRVEHFVSAGALVHRRLVEEVLSDFVIYPHTTDEAKTSLEHLEAWLSWWSRRRRRACLVPDMPRLCPVRKVVPDSQGYDFVGHEDRGCLDRSSSVQLSNVTRLMHYRYGQDLFWILNSSKPLGTPTIDCQDPRFMAEITPGAEYVVYLKMENLDDDFTFHHVMKCFGLNLASTVGYYEGIFRFSFRGASISIVGVPYSRFSPSLKDTRLLITAQNDNFTMRGRIHYRQHRHLPFTFERAPVIQVGA